MSALLTASANESDHALADRAMTQGNYAQAYCALLPLAQTGDAKAQHDIGWMYANGYGLAVDESKAIVWWRKAARQDHGNAQFALAMAYLAGEGVEKNESTAFDWLIEAARHGIDDALPVIRSRAARGSEAARSAIQNLIQTDPDLVGSSATVKVARANIRASGNKHAKIITTLNKGDALVYFSQQGNWAQIGIIEDGQIGWVYAPLIDVVAESN